MTVSSPYRQSLWSSRDIADSMRRQMSNYQEGVGKRLLDLRKSRRMSQEDAMAVAGVSLKTWRNWERGQRAPYERNWKKIQDGFELTDEEVAEIRGTPPTPLALGDDTADRGDQLDRIEAMLLEVLARLAPDPAGEEADRLSREADDEDERGAEAA